MYDRIGQQLESTGQSGLVRELYQVHTSHTTVCLETGREREHAGAEFDLSLLVKGVPDMISALTTLVGYEMMTGPNKILWDDDKKVRRADNK